MANEAVHDIPTMSGQTGNNIAANYEENSDDDGLGDFASEDLCDRAYLHIDAAAEDEAMATVAAADLKILHSSGASKIKRKLQHIGPVRYKGSGS
jgi:hypothetical protein